MTSSARDYDSLQDISIEKKMDTSRILDVGFVRLTLALAVFAGVILILVILQTAEEALPAVQQFGWSFLVTTRWNPVENIYGVLPQIYGSLMTSLVALIFAIPLGIGTAIFLTEDFAPKWITTPISFAIELIVAIPSVVLGLWGIFVLIPAVRPIFRAINESMKWFPLFGGPAPRGPSLLIVGLVLSIMISPIIISITRSTFESLPRNLRDGALALGATRWETILTVMIPAGLSGIVSSIMLAMGRAFGETMVAAMISGNANRINVSLLQPGSTITGLIASQFGEAGRLQVSALMYAGVVLMVLSLVANVLAEIIIRKFQNVER
ncbi:phosphate ABC transporter permease subunit PstC [Synechococcus sp. Nb3U1]|uniref:phosphate ABC transporter permease subunit PstC n=1 Tax=Synechococcus sp. Nb3U1 TaxID=1914529 RepID=UPI001F1E6D57|nr:phosphate ABC transporter permease subunit PstC [Synechococcus sp. Nb3U1]MCF2970686.1 phosphate ABC transporter permease subunit PstC [Synechococcus sp. Nb3U1]